VVALTPFKDAACRRADVMLPIAPFTETAGSFVNAEGRLAEFHGVVKPLGDARPAWKVLRVLGNLLGLPGFDQETVDDVRQQALGDVLHPGGSAWTTQSAAARAGAHAGRPAAGGRRAHLCHRFHGAPRAVAAADGRCQAAPWWACLRRCGSNWACKPVTASAWPRAGQRRAAGA
jgi:NADH dehydrogenase/NADH:ubiquinone oxidoreductase subunit G